MKKSLACAALVIIFVLQSVTGAVFADDDYPDHSNNSNPLLSWCLHPNTNGFTEYVINDIKMLDIELRYNNTVYGTWDEIENSPHIAITINIPDYIDVIDFDFYGDPFLLNSHWGYRSYYVLRFSTNTILNIDYVELYAQGSYISIPVLYYAQDNNYLYVLIGQPYYDQVNTTDYTCRVHIIPGSTNRIIADGIDQDFVSYAYYAADAYNSGTMAPIAQLQYLSSLLREVENICNTLNTTPSFDFDLSDIETLISNIQTWIFNQSGYNRSFLQQFTNSNIAAVYTIPRNIGIYGPDNIKSTYRESISFKQDLSSGVGGIDIATNVLMLNFDISSSSQYVSVHIPLDTSGVFSATREVKLSYCIAPISHDKNEYNNFVNNNTIRYDYDYSGMITYSAAREGNQDYFIINLYIPKTVYTLNNYAFYILFESTVNNASTFRIKNKYNQTSDSYYADVYASNVYANNAIQTMYLERIYYALLGMGSSSGGSTYPEYPSGPSEPGDETTNIYDIDIEFNSQIGDIHAFENVYINMFSDINGDFNPSQYGGFDDNITSTFTVMNSYISDFYGSIFDTEDIEGETVNHLSLGLFVIIPIIAFILLALFRRVTA